MRPFSRRSGSVRLKVDRSTYTWVATRLHSVYRENVKGEEIAAVLSELFRTHATDRRPGESFGDFSSRANSELVNA